MKLNKSRFDYKWVILALCFLMEFICLGFCSSNVGLYTVPVTEALKIDRLAYTYWSSIRFAVQVIVALYFGPLVNRFGVKKMACLGMLSLTGAVVLRAIATNVWFIYLSGAAHGLGIVFCGGTMASTIIRRWIKQDIGKYTGIVMSANGIGGATAAQIISPIINNGETFGYRKAYWLSAAISLVITVIIVIFLRDNPTDSPAVTTSKKKKAPRGAMWVGIEYAAVKKKAYFYAAAATVFLTGISLQSIGSITIVYMTDLGISPAFIATTATVGSLIITFSKFGIGAIYDKWGLRVALLICQIAALLTFVLKGSLANTTLGLVMAMIATVFSNIAAPLETVIISVLTNDLFGAASYTKVLGIFTAMNSLGLCLGAPLGEALRKLTGDYRICFWVFSWIIVLVVVVFQFVLNAAYRNKAAVLKEIEALEA